MSNFLLLPGGGGNEETLRLFEHVHVSSIAIAKASNTSLEKVLRKQRLDSLTTWINNAANREPARFDSIAGGGWEADSAMLLANQLDYVYKEVMRELLPVTSSLSLFPVDRSVPLGAMVHKVRRIYGNGEVKIYRKGMDIPTVAISQKEESFPVRYFVSSFKTDMFTMLSTAYAKFPETREKLAILRTAFDQFLNQLNWYGSPADGLYGILTYPWLAKKVISTPFTTAEFGANGDANILTALSNFVKYPRRASKGTMSANTLAVSPLVEDFLMDTPRSSDNDTSIGEFWLKKVGKRYGISTFHPVEEFTGAGPGGTDVMFAYRNEKNSVAVVLPSTMRTQPPQKQGFEDTTLAWQPTGGVIMRNVGNNILGYVTVDSL